MLQESYLLSLPRLKKDRYPVGDTSPECCRWLWLHWTAKILGWRGMQSRVQQEQIGADMQDALRLQIFPFPKRERDADGVPLAPP
jgi:hypothetical protein